MASPLAPAEVSARAAHYGSLLKCRFANIWGLQEMWLWQRSKLKQNKWQRLTHFSCWTCTYLLFKVQAHFPPFILLSKILNSLLDFLKNLFCKTNAKIIFSFGKRLRQRFPDFFSFLQVKVVQTPNATRQHFPDQKLAQCWVYEGNVILLIPIKFKSDLFDRPFFHVTQPQLIF